MQQKLTRSSQSAETHEAFLSSNAMYITVDPAQCGTTATVILNLIVDPEIGYTMMSVTGVQICS
jgi:hypothetical protein